MKTLLILLAICFSSQAWATEPPRWEMIPEQSSITFTAIQNSAPVQGKFTTFTTDIRFDPEALEKSSIYAEIDMASVTTIYEKIEENLRREEWFFVDKFLKAEFISNTIIHQETNRYIAEGTLIIRGQSLPFSLPFTLDITEVDGKNIARVSAETSLKRNGFGVGQGGWKNTTAIEDDVKIEIKLIAQEK